MITHSALVTLAAAALLAAAPHQSEAFGIPSSTTGSTSGVASITRSARTVSTSSFAKSAASLVTTSRRAGLVVLRAEEGESEADAEAGSDGGDVEASAEGEEGAAEAPEAEKEEDPEVVAIKESIADLEAKIKAKRNDLSSILDSVDKYSKAGYARKVAEMDQIRKMRGAASKSNEFTAKATILQDFLPVLDELVSLDAKYKEDEFAKSYKALRWDLNNAMTALGMSEFAPEVGGMADASRVVAVEEQYSDDYTEGTIISPISVGLELKGNVIRMAECVVSLGSEAEAEAAKEAEGGDDAAASSDDDLVSGLE